MKQLGVLTLFALLVLIAIPCSAQTEPLQAVVSTNLIKPRYDGLGPLISSPLLRHRLDIVIPGVSDLFCEETRSGFACCGPRVPDLTGWIESTHRYTLSGTPLRLMGEGLSDAASAHANSLGPDGSGARPYPYHLFSWNHVSRVGRSRSHPAISDSLDWDSNGLYIGAWGTSASFSSGTGDYSSESAVEIDFYGGYGWFWGELYFDMLVGYYTWPGIDPALKPAYLDLMPSVSHTLELMPSVSYSFADRPLEPTIGFSYGYSPERLGNWGEYHYIEGSMSLVLPRKFGVTILGGFEYWPDNWFGLEAEVIPSFSVAIDKQINGVNFELGYYGSFNSYSCEWDTRDGSCDNVLALTLSRSF